MDISTPRMLEEMQKELNREQNGRAAKWLSMDITLDGMLGHFERVQHFERPPVKETSPLPNKNAFVKTEYQLLFPTRYPRNK